MREKKFIEIIKSILDSKYIGDDCAYLKDLGIVVTQDNLVEDVHFKMQYTTPYQLGYKSAMVNISDICASGAEPLYMTISLSLPNTVNEDFIKEFYKGCKEACSGVEIVGGDITGSDKIFISVAVIGSDKGRKISSRSNARAGQKVIVSGVHGSSGAGLELLLNNKTSPEKFIKSHLMPQAQCEFSKEIAEQIDEDYAMMDTSDGLMDALSQIANNSGISLLIDFDKIPYDKDLEQFNNLKDLIFFGGEDYQLVATVPERLLKNLSNYTIIGEVKEHPKIPGVEVNFSNKTEFFTKKIVEEKVYNHFKGA